jgi:two-component system phosphate regulon sensor histidine kinase PhoR
VARKRLVWQLFPFFLLVTLLTLLAVTWYATRSWRQFYLKGTARDLEARARLVEAQLGGKLARDSSRLDKLCKDLGKLTSTRLTVILPSGLVLGDSEKDPARMDNHGDRPEFQEAMKGKVGVISRYSFTLSESMLYVAIPLKDQGRVVGVVRAALPMTAIDQALRTLYLQMALGSLAIALLVAVLSFFISRRLSLPLEELKRGARRFAQGDLGRKLPIQGSDELASLAEALNHMASQLEDRLQSLRRQGQEQEAILSSMVEGVLALDNEGRLITLNRAAAQMLGLSPEARPHLSLQEAVSNPELQWFVTRTLSTSEPIEGEIALKNGDKRILQGRGTSLRDSQAMVMGTLIVFHDVTQLRRLEQARRDFVANVSHELKTPITSIKGFVETLLAGALREPENAENFLGIIAQQTDRLNAIIDDLLSLSRIEQEAERGQIFLTGGKVKGVLEAALHVCENQAREKDIALELNCPDDLRARLNAPLLEQALVNLIDNAIKFSGLGSTVHLEAERAGPEVVIQVKDQGCGIPPEHLPRIFERFYRVDSGRSRKLGGTGLGLAIVKHIAQAHGGRVTVESRLGKGSVFSLHLLPD